MTSKWEKLLTVVFACSLFMPLWILGFTANGEEKVLFADDFSKAEPARLAPLSHYSWTAGQKAKTGDFSSLEIKDGALLLRISPNYPWGKQDMAVVLKTKYAYLPPECDAVRIKAKVVEGSFELSFGSPTVYFGCSDVFTAKQKIQASGTPDDYTWKTYEFSFNRNLTRNFRRAGRTKNLPAVQYTRWVQEPVYLYAMKGSSGEIEISCIEFVSKGEGKPFLSSESADAVKESSSLANFADGSALEQAFTFTLQDWLPVDGNAPVNIEALADGRVSFEYLPGKRQVWHPPPEVSLSKTDGAGIVFRKRFAEEIVFGGIKIRGAAGMDGLELDMKVVPEKNPPPGAVVDMLLIVSPQKSNFKWEEFVPSAPWTRKAPFNFNCYMGGIPQSGQDYALYHARVMLEAGSWRELIIPFCDFLCCYGQGDVGAAKFASFGALNPEDIIGIGFLAPFRHAGGITEISVRDIKAVKLAPSKIHASFHQNR